MVYKQVRVIISKFFFGFAMLRVLRTAVIKSSRVIQKKDEDAK